MIIQIICNIVLFLSLSASLILLVLQLFKFPSKFQEKINSIQQLENLSDGEKKKKCNYRYVYLFLKLLGICLLFMIIGAIGCLCDGLSDTEKYLSDSVIVFLCVWIPLVIFLMIYDFIMKRKFQIKFSSNDPSNRAVMPGQDGPVNVVTMGLCMVISPCVAFHCAMAFYTIALLLGY